MTDTRPGRGQGRATARASARATGPARPAGTSATGHGLVLVKGPARASARWLRRGLVATATVALPGWTAVCLSEAEARTLAPYDVGLEVLAARPTPRGLRPAIGLFVLDGCAIVTVQPRGWRADQRWLVWQPGTGVRRTPDLPALPAALIARVASPRTGVGAKEVAAHFSDRSGGPLDKLVGLLTLLGLPGEDLLRHGPGPGVEPIEPSSRTVKSFDALVHGDHVHDPHHPEHTP